MLETSVFCDDAPLDHLVAAENTTPCGDDNHAPMTPADNSSLPGTPSQPEPELSIDAEFKVLIPDLSPEERGQLEENLRATGRCHDSLLAWKHQKQLILLDGHHRFELCQKLDIKTKVELIELPDRAAAKQWIINNQIGRRNLKPKRQHYYLGKRYEASKQPHGGKRVKKELDSQCESMSTGLLLAKEAGVSASTISRRLDFAQAVDRLSKSDPVMFKDLLDGDRTETDILEEAAKKVNRAPKKANASKAPTRKCDSNAETSSEDVPEIGANESIEDIGSGSADGEPAFDEDVDDARQVVDDDGEEFLRLPREPKALATKLIEALDDKELAVIEKILQRRRQSQKLAEKHSGQECKQEGSQLADEVFESQGFEKRKRTRDRTAK